MRTNATRVSLALLISVAAFMVVGIGSARPSRTVEFSNDGLLWAHTLPSPLFDNTIRWIPGDSRTAQFRVRNNADTTGRLRLAVNSAVASFARSLSVSIRGADDDRRCGWLGVEAGKERLVEVRLDMASDAANETRQASASVELGIEWSSDGVTPCPGPVGSLGNHDQEGAQS